MLLEIAPADLDLDDVDAPPAPAPGVVDVHDLHAWTITSGMTSLSAHVTVHRRGPRRRAASAPSSTPSASAWPTHFDVRHTTFQVEPQSHQAHEDLGEMH